MKKFIKDTSKAFKDSTGKTVIWQTPNFLLLGWFICRIIDLLLQQKPIANGFAQLSSTFLFSWAYLEITEGVNLFRKTLGAVVAIATVWSFFW